MSGDWLYTNEYYPSQQDNGRPVEVEDDDGISYPGLLKLDDDGSGEFSVAFYRSCDYKLRDFERYRFV